MTIRELKGELGVSDFFEKKRNEKKKGKKTKEKLHLLVVWDVFRITREAFVQIVEFG